MFCVFEWWIDKLLWSNKNEDFVQSNCGKQIVFPIFLAATKKNVSLSCFFWIDWPWGSSVEDTAKPRKCFNWPEKWQISVVVSTHLKNSNGIISPNWGENSKNIWVATTQFQCWKGLEKISEIKKDSTSQMYYSKPGELNRSWLLLWKDFSNRILKGGWWFP